MGTNIEAKSDVKIEPLPPQNLPEGALCYSGNHDCGENLHCSRPMSANALGKITWTDPGTCQKSVINRVKDYGIKGLLGKPKPESETNRNSTITPI